MAAAGASGIEGLQVALAGEGSLSPPGCLRLGRVADPRPFLRALDAFVFPPHQEALPFALLEAMAAALPVIATAVGGIPEAVEDGVCGLLVPPRAPRDLAAALRRLHGEPGLAGRLGLAARARVVREFSAAGMVEGTVAVYRELDKARAE